jgi:acetamidase/formamidase
MARLGSEQAQYGWDRDRPPVLEIDPGAELVLELRDASDGQIAVDFHASQLPTVDWKRGNPMAGPIMVHGAHAGDTLQVEVLEVEPGPHGWTAVVPGFGLLADDFPEPALLHWRLDGQDAEAVEVGLRIPLEPFLGVIGVAADEAGRLPVGPPRHVGGNLDVRLLGPGASVFLPVAVPGALLGIGDPHGRQGDGEVCGTALETSARACVRVSLDGPRVEAPEYRPMATAGIDGGWYATTGVGPDLMAAAKDATRRMIESVVRRHGIDPPVAYMLCSALMDLRISEIVDRPNWVVSALWPEYLVEGGMAGR